MLTGFLRANGVEVLPIDANVEAFDARLDPDALGALRDRLEARLGELDKKGSLAHAEQLEYAALVRARGDAHAVPNGTARAKATFRDEVAFHDPDVYACAVATVDAALRVASATHHPAPSRLHRVPHALRADDDGGGRARQPPRRRSVRRLRDEDADPAAARREGRRRRALRVLPRAAAARVCLRAQDQARASRTCTSPAVAPASRRCSSG